MQQNITVVLTKPAGPTPTPEQNTETILPVPNTGEFAGTNSLNTLGSIAGGSSVLFMLAFIIFFIVYQAKKNNLAKILAKIFTVTFVTTVVLAGALQSSASADDTGNTNNTQDLTIEDFYLETELTEEDNFVYGKTEIKVNQATGYGYTITAYTTTPDLIHIEDDSQKIDAISSSSPVVLDSNTWGLSQDEPQDDTNIDPIWFSIPTSESTAITIKDTDSATSAGDTISLYYGVNINDSLKEGEYKGKVYFTFTKKPEPGPDSCPTKVPNITYMQELNNSNKATVLAGMTEDAQYYLKDNRDNKTYCVAKLKDGNIWMTQNLDHGIDKNFAYTPENTDIPANWTPDKSTYATGDTTWAGHPTGYFVQESYDPGDIVWDGVPSGRPVSFDNMIQGTDAHYHIGNYYTWSAAVAMNDTRTYTTSGQDVDQSICPAGWTLPKGGWLDSGPQTQPGAFQYLIEQYGWNSNTREMENPYIWEAPLYFSLFGSWYGRSYNYVRSVGFFWSPVVYDANGSLYLYVDYSGLVNPVSYATRDAGLSVRCVSR